MIILFLFGAKRIPEIAQGIGRGIVEFKKATREGADQIESAESKNDRIEQKM